MVRQRQNASHKSKEEPAPTTSSSKGLKTPQQTKTVGSKENDMEWATQNKWIVLAIASGACAAFNGVFAKLTTTGLTTSIAQSITNFLGLSNIEGGFEVVLRALFFGLNLVFNGVMWTLFTQALAKGNSTTQVSIINTGANFVITAVLGSMIFSEALPPLWWLGAALLVVGNVIVGRKDETAGEGASEGGYAAVPQQGPESEGLAGRASTDSGSHGKAAHRPDEDEDIIDLGDLTADGNDAQERR